MATLERDPTDGIEADETAGQANEPLLNLDLLRSIARWERSVSVTDHGSSYLTFFTHGFNWSLEHLEVTTSDSSLVKKSSSAASCSFITRSTLSDVSRGLNAISTPRFSLALTASLISDFRAT